MFEIFLFCTYVGGTLLVLQTALTGLGLIGAETEFGGEGALEFDGGLDGDFDADVDFEADADFDADLDAEVDSVGPDSLESTESDSTDSSSGGQSNWLFRVVSFRTLVAATAFFGVSGTASMQAGLSQALALGIAVGCGLVAMLVVHTLMRLLYRLDHDGTVRVADAKGRQATVYLPIPAKREGSGKVQVMMQDRVMEFEAVSSGEERLKTGTKVIVVDVLGPSLVEVEEEGSGWNRDPLYRATQIAISGE